MLRDGWALQAELCTQQRIRTDHVSPAHALVRFVQRPKRDAHPFGDKYAMGRIMRPGQRVTRAELEEARVLVELVSERDILVSDHVVDVLQALLGHECRIESRVKPELLPAPDVPQHVWF